MNHEQDATIEMEGLIAGSVEQRKTWATSTPPPARRYRVLLVAPLVLVGVLIYPQLVPSSKSVSRVKEDANQTSSATNRPSRTQNMSFPGGPNSGGRAHNASLSDAESMTAVATTLDNPVHATARTCHVPFVDSDSPPELSSTTSATLFANCSTRMGKLITQRQRKQASHLPANRQAHIFSFPSETKNTKGQRPLLCVPQKNGNKQFGGLVFAAWNKKAAKTGEGVDHDMKRWQYHEFPKSHKFEKKNHVYFIARNPYSRILSLYLQKVVNACISDGQKGCDRENGWDGIHADASFKDFIKRIEQKVAKHGSLCAANHHLCQQVESCLTTTLRAHRVTAIRLEEQSCWFPCLVKELGIKSKLLNQGWEQFSGQSCYYSATGGCHDMLRSIDPDKVQVVTGNVHATGASNRLQEHYDEETAEIVSRLYADDFEILGYPLWDGVSDP